MKARTSCWLAVCLLWTVWGAELTCPFAYLNESYFAMGKPPYLRTPKLQTQSTVCRATWGKQSCCDGPTLEAIKDRYAEFHRDIVAKASASMKMIKGVFEPVQKLNLIERIGSWSAIRLQVLIDKYLQPVKQQFYLLNVAMARCFRSVNQALAGFLCLGCSPTAELQDPNSTRPTLAVHPRTLAEISAACEEYVYGVNKAVDDFNRAKVAVIDYLSAEIGEVTVDCTCSGSIKNQAMMLDFSYGKQKRLLEETKQFSLGSMEQELLSIEVPYQKQASVSLRFVGNNTEVNRVVDELLQADKKKYINKHSRKYQIMQSYPRLMLAIYRKLAHVINTHNYEAILPGLADYAGLGEFTFDECETIIKGLINTFVETQESNTWSVTRLIQRLLTDYLLFLRPSAEMFMPPNNSLVNLRNLTLAYNARLVDLCDALVSGKAATVTYLPYILNGTLRLQTISPGSTRNDVAAAETLLLYGYPKHILLLPMFRILQIVTAFIERLREKLKTFRSGFIAALDKLPEAKRYLEFKYFPSFYYQLHPEDAPRVPTHALADEAVAFLKKEVLEDAREQLQACISVIRLSSLNEAFLHSARYITSRDIHLNNILANRGNLSKEAVKDLLRSQKLREKVMINKKCETDADCQLQILIMPGVVQNLTLPKKVELDVEKTIEDVRRRAKRFGKLDSSAWFPYDDETTLDMAKCARAYSPRTNLCLPRDVERILGFPILRDPPLLGLRDIGQQMMQVALRKNVYKALSELLSPAPKNKRRLLQTQEPLEMTFKSTEAGAHLTYAAATTGLETSVTIDGMNENSQVSVGLVGSGSTRLRLGSGFVALSIFLACLLL